MKPLKYGAGLSIQEAEERYKEVREEFYKVKRKYSGILSRFRKNLDEKDIKTLADAIGVLLPLSMEEVVQRRKSNLVTLEAITNLQVEISKFLANYKNTGVKILYSGSGGPIID